MHAIRSSCRWAARSQASTSIACAVRQNQWRAFSRSAACARGSLPKFTNPSSPELSNLLSVFNSKVLLPFHFTPEQERLVYSLENKARLEAEPIEITLGEVTLPLEHLDRNHLPNRWEVIRRIVHQSKTREDWENVVRLLEGLKGAGVQCKREWQEMIVRNLNLAGMQTLVLKALQRVEMTDLRLSHRPVIVQVLRGIHSKALQADWDQEETTQALRMANQVVDLLEERLHHVRIDGSKDYRSHPMVIALPTELSAVLVQRYSVDPTELKKLANRLVCSLNQNQYMSELETRTEFFQLSPADYPHRAKQLKASFELGNELMQLISLWHALKTTRLALAADMPLADDALRYETRLDQKITQGLQSMGALVTEANHTNQYYDYIRESLSKCQ